MFVKSLNLSIFTNKKVLFLKKICGMLVFETLKNKKSDFLNSNTCFCSQLYGNSSDKNCIIQSLLPSTSLRNHYSTVYTARLRDMQPLRVQTSPLKYTIINWGKKSQLTLILLGVYQSHYTCFFSGTKNCITQGLAVCTAIIA